MSQENIIIINEKIINFGNMLLKFIFLKIKSLAKIRKINFIIVLSFLIIIVYPDSLSAQSKYSIDKERQKRKVRKPFQFKTLFRKSAQEKAAQQICKDDRHKTKVMKNEQKAIKTYQKKANNNNEKGKNKKVYKRMREFDKVAQRRRENKPSKNFFQRLFSKQKSHKKSRKKKS